SAPPPSSVSPAVPRRSNTRRRTANGTAKPPPAATAPRPTSRTHPSRRRAIVVWEAKSGEWRRHVRFRISRSLSSAALCADASPRGGNPGFVHVAGPNRLLMPDRSGNNRIDSFRNIVEGSGFVQLIFFVPGIDETLRVGGNGKLSAERDLLASMVEFGKPPR